MQTHKNLKYFERAIRKRNKCPDFVKIKNIIYTLDCYDLEVKIISYGNKKQEKAFIIKTEDRYNKKFSDAIIEEIEPSCFRDDISYYE